MYSEKDADINNRGWVRHGHHIRFVECNNGLFSLLGKQHHNESLKRTLITMPSCPLHDIHLHLCDFFSLHFLWVFCKIYFEYYPNI